MSTPSTALRPGAALSGRGSLLKLGIAGLICVVPAAFAIRYTAFAADHSVRPVAIVALALLSLSLFGLVCMYAVVRSELDALRSEIRERDRVENELRQSEGRYRRLFEVNKTVQLLVDPDTIAIVDANPAACRFYGYSLEQLKNMRISDINTAPIENIREAVASSYSADDREYSFQHRLAGGEVRQVEIRPTRVEIHGRDLIHSIITDVTDRDQAVVARRIAEAKYEKIFENAIEGIFQTTPEGRYLSANPALARLYGYDTPAELMASVTDIGAQLYVDPKRRLELTALLDSQDSATFEVQVYRRDRSIIWTAENARAVRGSSGEVEYYEGTVQDITERKALEDQRVKMLSEAMERADHDPLTGLLNHRSFHKKLEEEADRVQRSSTPLAIVAIDLDNFKFFNDAYGHLAGDEVLQLLAGVLTKACRPGDTVARFGGDEFALLLPGLGGPELLAKVADISEQVATFGYRAPGYDVPIPLTISSGTAIYPDEAADRVAALELADARMIRSKSGVAEEEEAERLRRSMSRSLSGFSMLDALVTAVDNKDRYTRRHSEDVLTYCVEIARELGLEDRAVHDVKVAALLHDVGKIGVPDYLLRKPGRLNDDEFEAIKQHPMMGAVIVAAVPGLEHTLDAVRHHHERWDGEGYPWGLRGEEIPLTARLMAVADAFSAMTTDRPYRKSMPVATALRVLQDGANTQWDPECVAAFVRVHAPLIVHHVNTGQDATPLTAAFGGKKA